VRLLTLAFLALASSSALADDLIDIPTARKILFEDVRYEFRVDPDLRGSNQQFMGIGIGNSWELDLRDIHNPATAPVGTFDLAYNLLSAFPGGIAPGISFGVQDAANLTQDGRRFYAVTTLRNSMDELPGNVYCDVTLGFQIGSLTSPFVGVSMPFSKTLYLLAEDSGFRLSSGFEFRPIPRVSARIIFRANQTLLSLSATGKF
jgi:hypothetical protein